MTNQILNDLENSTLIKQEKELEEEKSSKIEEDIKLDENIVLEFALKNDYVTLCGKYCFYLFMFNKF